MQNVSQLKLTELNEVRKSVNILSIIYQARSQEFAMGGGAVVGAWKRSPEPLEAGGVGAKPPAAGGTRVWWRGPQRSKILHFFANIT